MTRLLALSIRAQMFLMALIVALPAFAIIIYSGHKLRQAAIEDARQEVDKIATHIVMQQEHAVAGAEQLMSALAQLPEIKQRDALRARDSLRSIRELNPIYMNLAKKYKELGL